MKTVILTMELVIPDNIGNDKEKIAEYLLNQMIDDFEYYQNAVNPDNITITGE